MQALGEILDRESQFKNCVLSEEPAVDYLGFFRVA